MTTVATARRVQRIRHEPGRREVKVFSGEPISPNMVSLILVGDALADFASEGFDDHVKLIVPGPDGELFKRDYTPRHFNRAQRELTIDFVMHDGGAASDWALKTKPGAPAIIGGPKSSMVIPMDYDWHLLAGDLSALPAIHRRLEELPDTAHAIVVVQTEAADQRPLVTKCRLDLQWLMPHQSMADALRSLQLPAGDGFVWCAGEAAMMAEARDVFLNEKQHPREAMRVAAYWKKNQDGSFHEMLERGLIED